MVLVYYRPQHKGIVNIWIPREKLPDLRAMLPLLASSWSLVAPALRQLRLADPGPSTAVIIIIWHTRTSYKLSQKKL